MGAYLNVRINASQIDDANWIEDLLRRGAELQEDAIGREQDILAVVNRKMEA